MTLPGPIAVNYVHATAVVLGEDGVLIRGASGSGKSRLALLLLAEAARRGWFAALVGDDRVALSAVGGRLLAHPHPAVTGRIESRFEGILSIAHEPACVVGLVIDLVAGERPRLPDPESGRAELVGVGIARRTLPSGLTGCDVPLLLDRITRSGKLVQSGDL